MPACDPGAKWKVNVGEETEIEILSLGIIAPHYGLATVRINRTEQLVKIKMLNDVFQNDWQNGMLSDSGDGIAEMKLKVNAHEISFLLLIGRKGKFTRAVYLKKAKITVDGKTVLDWHMISSGT